MNYVNEAKFIEWYQRTAKPPLLSSEALLSDVFHRYVETRCSEYILSAEQTVTGREERYPFRCESVGACGACTPFMYF